MNKSVETYLSLLRAGIWQTEAPETDPNLFHDVKVLAWRQGTIGLISDAWLRSKNVQTASSDMILDASGWLQSILMDHLNQGRILDRILQTLEGKGIKSVLLKGLGLSAFYANPMLRETGDIDLWVGPEGYAQALDCLLPLSKILYSDRDGKSKHTGLDVDGTVLEVHSVSGNALSEDKEPVYQAYAQDAFAHCVNDVQVSCTKVSIPEPTFNAYFVFHHFFYHLIKGGVGLRQVVDWAVLLESQKDVIDWERLREMVSSMGMERPWNVFLTLCVRHLGLSRDFLEQRSPRWERMSDRVLSRIIREGYFGKDIKHAKRSKWLFLDKAIGFKEIIERDFGLLCLFPSVEYKELRRLLRKGFRNTFKDKRLRFWRH